ncbi:TonB-dependent receptor plug domain-containing protein [Massilia glaciei]|uniref:TonB-dependent receptor n=1 Tax=Massilia glaciei TaxID=1524097 RepID=A0A2U2I5W5_9BURK|nr:TonB-dependent receptor [Massilia glaciei]PWF55160.1 TonB-dependent receptor [Massilia glaciei]
MNKLIPFACLALSGAASAFAHAAAQEPAASMTGTATATATATASAAAPAASAPADAAAPKMQQVLVGGTRANDTEARRNATASKMIFGREELDRNGDSNVGEILKRLPGVTMGGRPGRGGGGQVRMRGLGSGYTQMLVNGERAPAGFSIESLSPDQVERIEVIRGPVAEHSTQAIAGSINIVLREGYQQKDIQLRLADSVEEGRHSPSVSVSVPGKSGKLSYVFNGALQSNRQFDESGSQLRVLEGALAPMDERSRELSERRSKGLHLTPRLSYRFDNSDTLTFQPFLMSNRSNARSDIALERSGGNPAQPAPYARQIAVLDASSTFARGFGNWLHKMEQGAKLDVKFGLGGGRSESETRRQTFDAQGAPIRPFLESDTARMNGMSTGGKYTKLVGKGHLLAAGWDIEATNRTQNRVAEDDGAAQFEDSGVDLNASTRRLAGFVQDEWDITERWSAYLGLRWEGIRTASSGGANADVSNISRVWSPVLHTVWRIPGREKDQLRASLTRSYRAAPLNDMIAAPALSSNPSPQRPDRTGNPGLRPELATGVDLAYEHYIGKSGILSASGFVRNVDDLIRRQTTAYLRDDAARTPSFVSTPVNIGKARTSGVELEAKFQLADLMKNAPGMDLRANYSRFWSSVDNIPGPDNRLDEQARQSANLGLDYRMKGKPLTFGGSVNWVPAYVVQTSVEERVSSGVKRQLDLYGLWKINPNTQLRISGNNLLGDDAESGRTIARDQYASTLLRDARTYTSWSVRLETKL